MRIAGLTLVALVACNNGEQTTDSGLTAPTGANTTPGTGATGGATGTTAATDAGTASDGGTTGVLDTGSPTTTTPPTTGGPKLDLAQPDAGAGDGGCTKLDFLFVIDNSNSMAAEQDYLTAAFPGFIAAIQQALPDTSEYQIGVTKTDVFGFDDNPTPDPANPCPYALGGLISHATPDGQKTGTGASCGFASGENFMTAGPTLAAEFACAAKVGTKGNTGETQAAALLAAVGPELAAPGACNAGFVRPDALLVVVMITDEDDDWSPPDADAATDAAAWSAGLVAAKDGLAQNVAFILISGGDPRWPECKDINDMDFTGAAASPKLTALAKTFAGNSLGSVCQAGYEAYLADAIATISTACDNFTPPG